MPGLANISPFLPSQISIKIQFQSNEQNGNRETQLYEERIAELERDIKTKNQRIKRLEEILYSKRGRQTVWQQVREYKEEREVPSSSLPPVVCDCESRESSPQPDCVSVSRL